MIGATAGVGMVTHAASSAAGGLASKMILSYFTGINPPYNKESRRRMRYIQQKYAQAYGAGVHGEDACSVIQQIGMLLSKTNKLNRFITKLLSF